MRKSHLVLLTLVPIFVGWVINLIIIIPIIGMITFYILPFGVLAFWYWLGGEYSKTDWKPIPAILIGSGSGIVSLALYLWQFLGNTDESRNIFLASLSQMYCAATPSYLFGGIARLFEIQTNHIGRPTFIALQVISVLIMMIVFSIGYVKKGKYRRI